jgi:hypothetical protein
MQCLNRKGCLKKKHKTKEKATLESERMEERYHEPFNVYKCHICGYYHIGRCNGHEKVKVEEVKMEGN